MRLNPWQLLGIVLSIIWAVSAAIYQRGADIDKAERFAKSAYGVCANGIALTHKNDLTSCDHQKEVNLAAFMKGSWGNVAFLACLRFRQQRA